MPSKAPESTTWSSRDTGRSLPEASVPLALGVQGDKLSDTLAKAS